MRGPGLALFAFAAIFGVVTVGGTAAYAMYGFLTNGFWHWNTIAEFVQTAGYDTARIIDPAVEGWFGLFGLVRWIFNGAPACLIAFVVTLLLLLLANKWMSAAH